MCGIAGIIYKNQTSVEKETLKKMTDKMSHRGPDSEGFFVNLNLGLGHRRLSIIDTSESANQPFFFEDKHVLVFNGAIYNYIELKKELEEKGYTFTTSSDTEVLIAAYDYWGKSVCKSLMACGLSLFLTPKRINYSAQEIDLESSHFTITQIKINLFLLPR
ncbi:hypothetical protein A0O34_14010 [Chryseobacterium glaciei]|uniref:asparagine synthase (glutamine-hydrolyzing) n=1 Tax=Chryseobacterium glaciei TaxID=1685010 RepID=A0A172XWY5_9FLAO|nr:hypothetical protein A0O34_14010 [Chryseobacterium glaciei]